MSPRIQVTPLLATTVTNPDFHPLAGQEGPVHCFLIEHPDGHVLVDHAGQNVVFRDRPIQVQRPSGRWSNRGSTPSTSG